jgi:hypothetical protein
MSQKCKVTRADSVLPSIFQSHQVVSNTNAIQQTFTNSGTTGMITSKHLVTDTSLYEESKRFSNFMETSKTYVVLALLPSYLERSSLIYMVEDLIKSNHPESGFYLHNHDELIKNLIALDEVM